MSTYSSHSGNWVGAQTLHRTADSYQNTKMDCYYHDATRKTLVSNGLLPSVNHGKAGTNFEIVKEIGDEFRRTTVLKAKTGAKFTIAGSGNAAYGMALYTFPSKYCQVEAGAANVSFHAVTDPTATPVYAVGSASGTGAVAVLTGTNTFVNIVGSTAATDLNGTAKRSVKSSTPSTTDPVGDSLTAYFNIAANWSAADEVTIDAGSQITIHWKCLEPAPCLAPPTTV